MGGTDKIEGPPGVGVHTEGVCVAGTHVEDLCFKGLHLRRPSLQECNHCKLPHVLILAQQRQRRPAALLARAARSPAAAQAVQLLQLPVPERMQ